jgi:PAS domain S-box-containing protein
MAVTRSLLPWYRQVARRTPMAVTLLIGILLVGVLIAADLALVAVAAAIALVAVYGPAIFARRVTQPLRTPGEREREGRRQVELLEASIEWFRSVGESASDAMVCVDAGGRIRLWNRRAQAVFGYTEHEALGQSLAVVIPERYFRANEGGIEQYLLRDDPGTKIVELHGLRRDGAEIPLELALSVWRTGHETFYTGVFRDVTGRKYPEEGRPQSSTRAAAVCRPGRRTRL